MNKNVCFPFTLFRFFIIGLVVAVLSFFFLEEYNMYSITLIFLTLAEPLFSAAYWEMKKKMFKDNLFTPLIINRQSLQSLLNILSAGCGILVFGVWKNVDREGLLFGFLFVNVVINIWHLIGFIGAIRKGIKLQKAIADANKDNGENKAQTEAQEAYQLVTEKIKRSEFLGRIAIWTSEDPLLIIRIFQIKDEFDPNLLMDIEMAPVMTEEERNKYFDNIAKLRRHFHEMDLDNEPISDFA